MSTALNENQTFAMENSRPKAKRRKITPNCATVSTWIWKYNFLLCSKFHVARVALNHNRPILIEVIGTSWMSNTISNIIYHVRVRY